MKQIWMSVLGGILFLTACGQTLPAAHTTSIPVADTVKATPSPIPINTITTTPTETLTTSITPLPTIPTFTPTFDVSKIVTVTPAPPATCPKENPKIVAEFATPNSYGSYEPYRAPEVLDYLNAGGTLASCRIPAWKKPQI
jgi:hypothetical protein